MIILFSFSVLFFSFILSIHSFCRCAYWINGWTLMRPLPYFAVWIPLKKKSIDPDQQSKFVSSSLHLPFSIHPDSSIKHTPERTPTNDITTNDGFASLLLHGQSYFLARFNSGSDREFTRTSPHAREEGTAHDGEDCG